MKRRNRYQSNHVLDNTKTIKNHFIVVAWRKMKKKIPKLKNISDVFVLVKEKLHSTCGRNKSLQICKVKIKFSKGL